MGRIKRGRDKRGETARSCLFIFQYSNPTVLKITSRVFYTPIFPQNEFKISTKIQKYKKKYIRSTLDFKASADADRIIVSGRAFHSLMVRRKKKKTFERSHRLLCPV